MCITYPETYPNNNHSKCIMFISVLIDQIAAL